MRTGSHCQPSPSASGACGTTTRTGWAKSINGPPGTCARSPRPCRTTIIGSSSSNSASPMTASRKIQAVSPLLSQSKARPFGWRHRKRRGPRRRVPDAYPYRTAPAGPGLAGTGSDSPLHRRCHRAVEAATLRLPLLPPTLRRWSCMSLKRSSTLARAASHPSPTPATNINRPLLIFFTRDRVFAAG